jgi:Fe2+ transport system protein B
MLSFKVIVPSVVLSYIHVVKRPHVYRYITHNRMHTVKITKQNTQKTQRTRHVDQFPSHTVLGECTTTAVMIGMLKLSLHFQTDQSKPKSPLQVL